MKAVLRVKFITLSIYFKKEEMSKIRNITFSGKQRSKS